MTKYIAFIRGVMPGHPRVNNTNLKKLFENLGLKNVRTFIASGNVLFESEIEDSKALEQKIESAMPDALGQVNTTIIRSQRDLSELVANNPFKITDATKKPNVTFFKSTPDKNKIPDKGYGFESCGILSEAFCYNIDTTVIKTPEAMVTLEKFFGKEITTRTWNTVMRVHKLMSD